MYPEHLQNEIEFIEAWKLIEAFTLLPTTFDNVYYEVRRAISYDWLDALSFTCLSGLGEINGKISILNENHLIESGRILGILVAASSGIPAEEMNYRLHRFIKIQFRAAESGSLYEAKNVSLGVNDFIDALYNLKPLDEVRNQIGAEYIGVSERPPLFAMCTKAVLFFEDLFIKTTYLDKVQAVTLLGKLGYGLQKEIPGLSHSWVNKILEANTTAGPLLTVAEPLPLAPLVGADNIQLSLTDPQEVKRAIQEAMKKTTSLTNAEGRYLKALLCRLDGMPNKEAYCKAFPDTVSIDINILAAQGKKYCARAHEIARDKLGVVFDLSLVAGRLG